MKRATKTLVGSLIVGLSLTMAAPTQATAKTINVPADFMPAPLSDTRATGHYEVVSTGLRIWTEGSTSTDKVAEYVATSTPLADVGSPTLEYTATSGGRPGFQLVVDFDGNGTADGILVGEPVYGGNWWLNNAAAQFVKDVSPTVGGGGSTWNGTLAAWQAAFSSANVVAFGFSLGSGVLGDGILNAINFAGDRFTFTVPVVLTNAAQCKKGGWRTSTAPVFADQGQCVSSFTKK